MIETLICKAFRIKAAHTVSKFQLENDLFINFFCERRVGRFLFLQADDISCSLVIKFFYFFF